MGAHIHVHPNGHTLNLHFCFSFYRYGLIRRTAADRPHRNFTSPHTDGPSPLPATLLTLGLWLDGSIIVPAHASSPHKLPCSFCGLGGYRSFPLGSRGAPAVRLGMDRKYPICLCCAVFLRAFFVKERKAFNSLQKHIGL